ncbi:MAG: DUF4405 domain-containing protein [Candidatus Cloacimonetes bacterium]|nr:DUF4405 domain-containing protein [Candidatus Cloacimonadota bacterium]
MRKRFLILLIFLVLYSFSYGWEDCPFGLVDDKYPGKCALYIDTDNDSICDYSQPAPENREKIEKKDTVEIYLKEEINEDDNIGLLETERELLTRKYHFIPIVIGLVILYLISFVLSKLKIFTRLTHRRIWNCILLISFLLSSIFGIMLIIRINFGLSIVLPINILFWHVEFGIVMFVVGIFHALYNWRFYKYLLMKK